MTDTPHKQLFIYLKAQSNQVVLYMFGLFSLCVSLESCLTHHDVLHDCLKHHLLKDALDQDETGKILKDQLLETRQVLQTDVRLIFRLMQ